MRTTFDGEAFYEPMYQFALECQKLIKLLPLSQSNNEYSSQLIRSSGSVGANYIEALEALSKNDFIHRLRISRKETRESVHWLRLFKDTNDPKFVPHFNKLISEGTEIKKLLSSSIIILENKNSKTEK